MAHHKSAQKRIRQTVTRTLVNQSRVSRMKTFIKKAEEAVASKDLGAATIAFREAESEVMKSAQKGVIHSNTASRRISKLARKLKTIEKSP